MLSALEPDALSLLGSKQTMKQKVSCWLLPARKNKIDRNRTKLSSITLNPADLCCRAIALLVFSCNAENDSRTVGGRAVDVGVVQLGGVDGARHFGAAVDPDESHLTRTFGTGGSALPHRHVHGILQDAARWRGRGLPRDVD